MYIYIYMATSAMRVAVLRPPHLLGNLAILRAPVKLHGGEQRLGDRETHVACIYIYIYIYIYIEREREIERERKRVIYYIHIYTCVYIYIYTHIYMYCTEARLSSPSYLTLPHHTLTRLNYCALVITARSYGVVRYHIICHLASPGLTSSRLTSYTKLALIASVP